MTESDKLGLLILKYAEAEPMTQEEQHVLEEWRGRSADHFALADKFRDMDWVRNRIDEFLRVPSAAIIQKVRQRMAMDIHVPALEVQMDEVKHSMDGGHKARRIYSIRAVAIAASLLILIGAGLFIWQSTIQSTPESTPESAQKSAQGPKNAGQGSQSMALSGDQKDRRTWIMVSTPKGTADKLVLLEDGTRVWLNAGSTLNYPAVFSGAIREVELSGEAYFDIRKDPERPFLVHTGKIITEDIGTRFNIKAYPGETRVKISLLEGAVKVSNGEDSVTLNTPMQEADAGQSGAVLSFMLKDTAVATAWQRGYFDFKGLAIDAAAREVARCYGKGIRYEGPVDNLPTIKANGEIGRNLTLGDILEILNNHEKAVAHFSIDGDTIVVHPIAGQPSLIHNN